jgi:mxaC protein
MVPPDWLSSALDRLLRGLAISAMLAVLLGLAGLYQGQQTIERIGYGANIVLLLDRSNSMDNSFAGKSPSGGEESKTAAARRLLQDFVAQREHDRIGVVEYSTSALFVLPLTENKQAVQAAIAASGLPALAYTNISKGLAMALGYFNAPSESGSRIVLLISDGAAAIDKDSDLQLRTYFKQQNVRLYWVFLRTANSPGIFSQPTDARDDNAEAMPERYLHRFFQSLQIPYQAYEAESPQAMQDAIADINRLEHWPLHYHEQIPKKDLSAVCYQFAAGLIALLLLAKFCEAKHA